jgi:hypothetical protein
MESSDDESINYSIKYFGIDEQYKEIPNFSNYEISNLGNVRNKLTLQVLKSRVDCFGFRRIAIKADSKKLKTIRIYTVVMNLFKDNNLFIRNNKETDELYKNRADFNSDDY